ncbi:histidine kinase [Sporosarcina sp. P13]|uniref:sensor histidine kinase n=1 Tax=Sporosarcina sp. P13 TaxID=2048263 RepID=UPI000C165CDD|nr:PocR ligand-binding domain-containing protein [Sporosarcina sp. P13]PIC63224.1 histidine kinase [Sporosarcina sp. P13]
MVKNLREFVNIDQLQKLQEQFAEAMGVAVLICDAQGNPMTEPSQFTAFCKYIRSCSEGLNRCILSDDKVGKLAANSNYPVIHRCHTGLVDFAAPIILRDEYLGSILCGQVLLEEEELHELPKIELSIAELPLDQGKLQNLYNKVERKNKSRVQSIAELLFITANYIVKLGDAYLTAQELSIKNEKLLTELKHRSALEQQLKDTQLKVLQAQVNPHFLFNTLNTISRLAYVENAIQTEQVTQSLGKILRYSLRNMEQLISIEEEVEQLQQYLLIQKTRYRDQIHVIMNISEDSKHFKIPIFTLQPIIENSIVHGFETSGKPITITVESFIEDSKVIINIKDTGIGIGNEDKSTDHLSTGAGHTTRIGLDNVDKRIKHYYGQQWGINKLEQLPEVGTLVQLSMPYDY